MMGGPQASAPVLAGAGAWGMAGGIALCGMLALAAMLAAPSTGLPAMVLVLLFGMAIRAGFPAHVAGIGPGIDFTARSLLRLGVALLGLHVVAGELAALGARAVVLVLLSVLITVVGGYGLGWLLGQPVDRRVIATTSVAICGASAALAASALVPRREGMERETCVIIAAVSLLGTVAMVVYPVLAHLLAFDARATGVLLGAAIHDVAQVAGAGFAVSPQVGVEAVAVKMIRVACLLPVVMAFGWIVCRAGDGQGRASAGRAGVMRSVPPFLLCFFLLAMLASTHLVPTVLIGPGRSLAGALLTAAVAAIGLRTALTDFRSICPRLLALLLGQTLLQLVTVLLLVGLFFP